MITEALDSHFDRYVFSKKNPPMAWLLLEFFWGLPWINMTYEFACQTLHAPNWMAALLGAGLGLTVGCDGAWVMSMLWNQPPSMREGKTYLLALLACISCIPSGYALFFYGKTWQWMNALSLMIQWCYGFLGFHFLLKKIKFEWIRRTNPIHFQRHQACQLAWIADLERLHEHPYLECYALKQWSDVERLVVTHAHSQTTTSSYWKKEICLFLIVLLCIAVDFFLIYLFCLDVQFHLIIGIIISCLVCLPGMMIMYFSLKKVLFWYEHHASRSHRSFMIIACLSPTASVAVVVQVFESMHQPMGYSIMPILCLCLSRWIFSFFSLTQISYRLLHIRRPQCTLLNNHLCLMRLIQAVDDMDDATLSLMR